MSEQPFDEVLLALSLVVVLSTLSPPCYKRGLVCLTSVKECFLETQEIYLAFPDCFVLGLGTVELFYVCFRCFSL